jgi:hypothetical protein
VVGRAFGALVDLLAAGDACGGDERGGRFGAYGGEQAVLAYRHRDLVVLGLEAE